MEHAAGASSGRRGARRRGGVSRRAGCWPASRRSAGRCRTTRCTSRRHNRGAAQHDGRTCQIRHDGRRSAAWACPAASTGRAAAAALDAHAGSRVGTQTIHAIDHRGWTDIVTEEVGETSRRRLYIFSCPLSSRMRSVAAACVDHDKLRSQERRPGVPARADCTVCSRLWLHRAGRVCMRHRVGAGACTHTARGDKRKVDSYNYWRT
eukprot:3690767-Prymnesium_polylepis.3